MNPREPANRNSARGQIFTGATGTFALSGTPKEKGTLWVRITEPPKGSMMIDRNGHIFNKVELGQGVTLFHAPPETEARELLGKALAMQDPGYLFGLNTAMLPQNSELSTNESGTGFLAEVAEAASNQATSTGQPIDGIDRIVRAKSSFAIDPTAILIGAGILVVALALALGWKAGAKGGQEQ